ncbi:MAG: glycosyltransferase family 39 protein [Saprospiraceae bacterium]|nr:glycosyltransferase family 39 protein [Saprospiraceae bacterium]
MINNPKNTGGKKRPVSPPAPLKKSIPFPLLITISSMVLSGIVRLNLLQIPFERDEGGFAYIGRHLFSDLLYTNLFDNKLPGLYGLYALFSGLFGYSPGGIHFGLLICNLAAIWLIYKLFGKLFNDWTGSVSASVFALTSLSPNVYGFAAHANQLLMPFAIGGLLLLNEGLQNRKIRSISLAGLLLGLAFIIKQQVVTYGVFAGVWLLWQRWHERAAITQTAREIVAFSISAMLPFGLVCLYFLAMGRFNDLWIWTVELPAQLGSSSVIGDRWNIFNIYFSKVIAHFELIWGFALLGWVALFFSAYNRRARVFGLLFPLFCMASVLIGVAFYQHYFVLCLPAIALLAGVLVDTIRSRLKPGIRNQVAVALVALLALVPVAQDVHYYVNPDFIKIHRQCYDVNPFPELQQIGAELGRRSQPGDKIGILGSEPEILVYAKRNSATGHLFLYNLLSQGPRSAHLQQQYLDDLNKNKPAYLVWVTSTGSWGTEYYRTDFFKNTRPIVSGYTLCGKAEAFENGQPGVVVWDNAALQYQFKGKNQIYIYKRR